MAGQRRAPSRTLPLLLLLRLGVVAAVRGPALSLPVDEAGGAGLAKQALAADMVQHVLDFVAVRSQLASCSANRSEVLLWGRRGVRRRLRGHEEEVSGMMFLEFGSRLLTWSRDRRAMLWDAWSGEALREVRHEAPVRCAGVLGGGRVVTCVALGHCLVWSEARASELRLDFDRPVMGLAVFPAGDRVVMWGTAGRVPIWETTTGGIVCDIFRDAGSTRLVRVFANGERVVSGGRGPMAIWDASTCAMLLMMRPPVDVADIAVLEGQGMLVAVEGRGGVSTWSTTTGRLLTVLVESPSWYLNSFVGVAAFRNGVAGFSLNGVGVWNAKTGNLISALVAQDPDWTCGVAVSPGGDAIAIRGRNNVTVWDGNGLSALRLEARASGSCLIAVGPGRAMDPDGFGRGVSPCGLAER